MVLVISTAFVLGCGGQQRTDTAKYNKAAEEAYKQVRERRKEANTEERLAITKAFLAKFPESRQTASALAAVFYYQGGELGDKAGAIAYAEEIRDGINDPGIGQEIDRKLVGFYGESGMMERMVALADRLAGEGALDYGDHWNIIESAVQAEDWELVRDYCARARRMANADAVRADYPDRDLSDEELAENVDNRVGMLLVKDGWARANQGETEQALADFARAAPLIPRYYFDLPEYDLNVYWGKVLIMRGDFEGAIEKLETAALIMRNDEALSGLRDAYVGIHGTESGYEEWSAAHRPSIATTIGDFEMPDYGGKRHRFSDIRSDVTLVSLWFPT
jgi:tetratricopeptide (TPR) repeat protein